MIGVLLTLVLAADDAPPAAPALAQGQRWSVVGALTAGPGGNVVEGGLGWPGLSASYSRGLAPNFDLGVRISLNYGLEGLVTRVLPGAKLQGVVKFRAVESGPLSVAFIFEPGPLFAVDQLGNSLIGFAVPVGFRMGIAVSSAITLGLSVDVPLWVQFGGGGASTCRSSRASGWSTSSRASCWPSSRRAWARRFCPAARWRSRSTHTSGSATGSEGSGRVFALEAVERPSPREDPRAGKGEHCERDRHEPHLAHP